MASHDISVSVVGALLRSKGETHVAPSAASGEAGPARPPFSIAISREAGALGHTVAEEVGHRLGWPVYDQELLDKIGEDMRRPSWLLQALDERPGSLLEEFLAGLASQHSVSPDRYIKYMIGAVRGLGQIGHCVIVGRGANFILPAETTLRVRLVASAEDRARVIAARLNLGPREAAAWVHNTEQLRAEFVRRIFRLDVTDAHHYDLVLNMSRLSVDAAAEVIVGVLRRLEARSGSAAPKAAADHTGSPGGTPSVARPSV
jgi:cytidylate kinase